MAILGFDLEEIARLIKLAERHRLDDLIVEEGDRCIRIRGSAVATASSAHRLRPGDPGLPAAGGRKAISADGAAQSAAAPPGHSFLHSPSVGVFYRSDKPGAPHLIEIGDHVTTGQPIGVIEAMKVFSEIPAERSGTVVAVPAEDGQLVQPGDPLVLLREDA